MLIGTDSGRGQAHQDVSGKDAEQRSEAAKSVPQEMHGQHRQQYDFLFRSFIHLSHFSQCHSRRVSFRHDR